MIRTHLGSRGPIIVWFEKKIHYVVTDRVIEQQASTLYIVQLSEIAIEQNLFILFWRMGSEGRLSKKTRKDHTK